VGSNWGNWQYLAGVGADPRSHRKFDLQKQTQLYDPDEVFIRKWEGDGLSMSVDAVDMVDWPLDNS
jgi:deoxyribodipyrimidine photo-lyase